MMNNDWEAKDPFESPDAGGDPADGDGADPQHMPLNMMTGGEEGFEDFSLPKKKSGSTGMLVLVLAVLVGAAVLWAMRAGSGDPVGVVAGEAEQKIEAALARLAGGDRNADPAATTRDALDDLFRDTDEVIAMFDDDPTRNQVDLEELQKNPFALLLPRAEGDDDTGPTTTTADAAERERRERLAQLEREHRSLRLQSVITGNPSAAVIDNNVVRVGDEVGSFEVTAIGQQAVRLAAEGEVFTLRLDSPSEGTSLRR